MENKRIVIGSRASKLALVQAQYVQESLSRKYPDFGFEIKTIKTTGDKILDTPLSKIGDKGLFTKELEEALLRREIDLAVHSMKDLPTELPLGLKIAAVTKREDLRDVLVSRGGYTIETLPKGARVGTSSLRRRAQALHLRPDVEVLDLRGNLDTRIKKLNDGLYDAIIVAYAGIKRLGFTPLEAITEVAGNQMPLTGLNLKLSVISLDKMLPAACQGALGIETLDSAKEINELLNVLDDTESHLAIDAERAVLFGLGGGCQVPIGVCAEVKGNEIFIRAGVFSLDGKEAVRDEISGNKSEAAGLGKKLSARILKSDLAREILRVNSSP